MPSTFEGTGTERRRGGLLSVLLLLLTITLLESSAVRGLAASERHEISPAAVAVADSARTTDVLRCPAGEIAITPADVGIGDAGRCLPVGGAETGQSRIDPLYSRVAAGLAQRIAERAQAFAGDVKVICWNKDDWRELNDAFGKAGQLELPRYWLGWVRGDRGVINLSYPACKHLDDVAYRGEEPASQATGAAVGTLAHELMHVAGISDEGIADCYAMQLTAVTALELGTDREYADLLRTLNLEFTDATRSGTEYDSPECYDGGPLDLAPEDPRWP
jgi:hypothetical protein